MTRAWPAAWSSRSSPASSCSNAVIGIVTYVTLLERKFAARMQSRIGPYRVGPHGLLQPIADALKLMMKEDIIPTAADRRIFNLAPVGLPHAVHADLRDDPVRAGPRRRRSEHRHPVLPGRVVDGNRRPVHGRLGFEQQVRAHLGDARRQPDHFLRSAVHLRGARAGDADRVAAAVRHRGRADGPVVHRSIRSSASSRSSRSSSRASPPRTACPSTSSRPSRSSSPGSGSSTRA